MTQTTSIYTCITLLFFMYRFPKEKLHRLDTKQVITIIILIDHVCI